MLTDANDAAVTIVPTSNAVLVSAEPNDRAPIVPVVPAGPENQDVPPIDQATQPAGQVSTPEDLRAASERLKQRNSQQSKLLQSLGIDPLSDLAEQLEQGVVTAEQVQQHVARRFAPAQTQTQTTQQPVGPLAVAENDYQAAKANYVSEMNEGQITLQTNTAYLEAMQALSDAKLGEVTRQINASRDAQHANDSLGRVLNIAHQEPEYAKMPPGVQEAFNRVSVSMTGMTADREARAMGLDPAALTPQQVEYFAARAQQNELRQLRDHFIGVGIQQARAGLRPNVVSNNMPIPIGSAGYTPAPPNPYANATVGNHAALAQQYVASNRQI